ncbi:LysM peptidoglycan-binding domain-containing M23 family metallopeptidase [Streptomyces sp. NPDC005526]|uniref:LysM peptidoglycan-binding domain-containing M23 family metallopeptidase n=1 Tax=Streptomyces sp. NPDC005526 TaxID=3156885 RepID=UPI0033AE72DA
MPAKGKHRRPKTQRLTRVLAAAGTGGAVLALPLIGAAGAHAAPAQSVTEKTVRSAPAAAKAPAAKGAAARTYTVRPGDSLSGIAEDQHVRGGWKQLYQDNRRAVGDNPALIHPGLKLTLGHAAAGATRAAAAPKPATAGSSAAASAAKAKTVSAARVKTAVARAERAAATGFTLPVTSGAVGTGYHVAGSHWASGYHTGVDFVVPTGTPVKAVGRGTVVSAGWGGAYGNQVVLRLQDGHYAQYAHLSALSVSAGQAVTTGQRLGLSGATGNVTGPHLHFEIRTTPNYGSDVDPVAYLRAHGAPVA